MYAAFLGDYATGSTGWEGDEGRASGRHEMRHSRLARGLQGSLVAGSTCILYTVPGDKRDDRTTAMRGAGKTGWRHRLARLRVSYGNIWHNMAW
jgi:hypothetical protein